MRYKIRVQIISLFATSCAIAVILGGCNMSKLLFILITFICTYKYGNGQVETFLEDPFQPLKTLLNENNKKILEAVRQVTQDSLKAIEDTVKKNSERLYSICTDKSGFLEELKKRDSSLEAFIIKETEGRISKLKSEMLEEIIKNRDMVVNSCQGVKRKSSLNASTENSAICKQFIDLKGGNVSFDLALRLEKEEKNLFKIENNQENIERLINSQQISFQEMKESLNPLVHSIQFLPRTCSDHFNNGFKLTGTYTVFPNGDKEEPLKVKCDMQDDGGGWMIFLERAKNEQDTSFHEEFNRTWSEYVDGFGHLKGEHWMGLKWIHFFTSRQDFKMKVEIQTIEDGSFWAEYDLFRIEDDSTNYKLHVEGFKGTLNYNALKIAHKGLPFSTWDKDHDSWPTGNCAASNGGGWWYSICHKGLLTATHSTSSERDQKTLRWYHNKRWLIITHAVMKIKER